MEERRFPSPDTLKLWDTPTGLAQRHNKIREEKFQRVNSSWLTGQQLQWL